MDCIVMNGDYCRVLNFDLKLVKNCSSVFVFKDLDNALLEARFTSGGLEDVLSDPDSLNYAREWVSLSKYSDSLYHLLTGEESGQIYVYSTHPSYKRLLKETGGTGQWACCEFSRYPTCKSIEEVTNVALESSPIKSYNFDELYSLYLVSTKNLNLKDDKDASTVMDILEL